MIRFSSSSLMISKPFVFVTWRCQLWRWEDASWLVGIASHLRQLNVVLVDLLLHDLLEHLQSESMSLHERHLLRLQLGSTLRERAHFVESVLQRLLSCI